MVSIKHRKTNTVPDWTQTDLDTVIAGGAAPLPPEGTLISEITVPSDWNDDHELTGTIPATNLEAAGSNTQIQFNNAGAFGGAAATSYAASGTHLTLTALAATDKPLVLKGAAFQTANLQEWQNSSGVANSFVTATGGTVFTDGTAASTVAATSKISAAINVRALIVTNTGAAPTLLIDKSGANRSGIAATALGVESQSSDSASFAAHFRNSAAAIVMVIRSDRRVAIGHDAPTGQLHVLSTVTTNPVSVFQAMAGQTANITQWQNVSGTVLASIDNLGNITAPNLGTASGLNMHVGTTAPVSPSVDDLWVDTN